jgi:hypothetical protein
MGKVVFELAKWLLWVELFDRDDRPELATELLQDYVLNKHNGHVSRLNCGHESEVLSQVERIVASAMKIADDSAGLFERIRENRRNGKYWHPIRIAPLLSEGKAADADQRTDTCTTYCLPLRNDVLPAAIEEKLFQYARVRGMRRSQGEFPFIRFSRTLLNTLWSKKGSARISTEELSAWVTNVHQQNNFKIALRHLDLLRDWTGTYRSKSVSCLYCLTEEAMACFKMEVCASVERAVPIGSLG